jgi:photosynthetic reaction center cytochrome c subunit
MNHKPIKHSSKVGCLMVTVVVASWLFATPFAAAQPASQPNPKHPTSDQVFKNVQVLKGIPVDDFLGTMGIMCAALGFDCSECHTGAGTEKVDWAADNPRKLIARRMVQMMTAINRDNFNGRQMVTCWSCHRGRDRPLTTPTMENMYGPVAQDMDDVLVQAEGQPPAEKILDQYIQAVGGAAHLAKMKSYVATGSSAGFGGFGKGGQVEIIGKFPDQRATSIMFPKEPARGHSIRAFDGHEAWLRTPLTVLSEYQLTGGELDGAKLDAELAFPAQIKSVLTDWRVSMPATISDLPAPSSQAVEENKAVGIGKDRLVNVVQGRGPNGIYATLYFDQQSGLLLRVVRYGKSPIGRVPTQVDYSDYRDVDGIKMPFHILFAWLGGRDEFQLNQVQVNVPVDARKFGRPPTEKHSEHEHH